MVGVSDLDAILLDMDGTILDTTEELCLAVAEAVNRMREEEQTNLSENKNGNNDNSNDNGKLVLPSLPELHHTDIITKYPNLFGAPLEEFHDTIIGPHLNYCNSNSNDGSIEEEEHRRHFHAQSTKLFIKYFLQAVKEQAVPCPAFPDVLKALDDLAQKYPSLQFGVATTKPTAVAEADLTSASVPPSLRSLIRHVQGTDPGILPKPEPDVLLHCAKAMDGVNIGKTIYIGDTRRDAQAAKAAGCAACLTVVRPRGGDEIEGDENDKNNKSNDKQDGDALGADGLIRSFEEIEAALDTIILPDNNL